VSAFPATRLRRLRRTDALRSLVRETRLDLDDFVMPFFAGPSTVRAMPDGHTSETEANPSRLSVASPVLLTPGASVPGTPARPLT